jgi:HD-GYP domain-containing protein (c-di-GMP phosphodiesterase class II)
VLAGVLADHAAELCAGLDAAELTQVVVDAEPGGPIWLSGDEVDVCLTAVADFGDFKSPHMLGHSRRVAEVARSAASAASLPERDVVDVGRAALIHDVGRIGLQAQLLIKTGELTAASLRL